jgi:nicotinamide riboside transporter PnuC
MSSITTTAIEWVCTLLSIYGSWLCIRHRASGFVVFLVADLGWFFSAWMSSHPSLLAQQFIYILLNLVGYAMWRQDERLRWGFARIQASGNFSNTCPGHDLHLHVQRAAA